MSVVLRLKTVIDWCTSGSYKIWGWNQQDVGVLPYRHPDLNILLTIAFILKVSVITHPVELGFAPNMLTLKN